MNNSVFCKTFCFLFSPPHYCESWKTQHFSQKQTRFILPPINFTSGFMSSHTYSCICTYIFLYELQFPSHFFHSFFRFLKFYPIYSFLWKLGSAATITKETEIGKDYTSSQIGEIIPFLLFVNINPSQRWQMVANWLNGNVQHHDALDVLPWDMSSHLQMKSMSIWEESVLQGGKAALRKTACLLQKDIWHFF